MTPTKDTKSSRETRTKAASLYKLAQFRAARWANRRQVEWKVSAGVWAALVAASSAILIKGIKFPGPFLFAALFILVLLHGWWVYQNWKNNTFDTHQAFQYLSELHVMVSSRPVPEPPKKTFNLDAVPLIEWGITALLSAVIVFLNYG